MSTREDPSAQLGTPAPSVPGPAPASEPAGPVTTGSWLRAFITRHVNELSLVAGLFVLGAFLTVQSDVFLTQQNMVSILRAAAFLAIVTWGMSLVIVGAEIDVSVGPAVAFSSVLFGYFAVRYELPILVAVALVVVVTTSMGAFGGYLRARFNVPSFVATLALWSVYDGLKQVLSDNQPRSVRSDAFIWIGQEEVLGIPGPVIVAGVLFVVFRYVSLHTTYGRSVYAVGGNAEAAYASGINVRRIRVLLFATTGCLAALTGLLQTSRLGTATPNVASGLEFSSIAAVVIGGTALFGGRGSMVGSLLGVLFITVVSNGLVLLGVDSQWQNVVRGLLIIAAVLVNVLSKRNESGA